MSGLALGDSTLYGHLWATDETRALFDDAGRTTLWIHILGALAEAQAELAIVPAEAARAIAARAAGPLPDLAAVGEATRATGHSTLGLLRVLQADLPDEAAGWLGHGATVQDVTDTWTGVVARTVLGLLARDVGAAHERLATLARRHRDDLMLGRTHGQPGAPITFGLKAAGWAAELGRTLRRAEEARPRLAVAQLGGAVGSMAAFGAQGPELQRRLAARLGLAAPDLPWTAARDRVAELVGLLALATGALARIGREVATLQRPELAELAEAPSAGTIGSITMPQKHNPERAEHLVTLAGVVRAQMAPALEGLVGAHERDGATWKGEWALLPAAGTAAGASFAHGRALLDGLRVDPARMRANLHAYGAGVLAEAVLVALVPHVGRTDADALVRGAVARATEAEEPLAGVLAADAAIAVHLPADRLRALLRPEGALGAAAALVDDLLATDATAGGGPPPPATPTAGRDEG